MKPNFALIVKPIPNGHRTKAALFLTRHLGVPRDEARQIVRDGGVCGIGEGADLLLGRSRVLDRLVGAVVSRVDRVSAV